MEHTGNQRLVEADKVVVGPETFGGWMIPPKATRKIRGQKDYSKGKNQPWDAGGVSAGFSGSHFQSLTEAEKEGNHGLEREGTVRMKEASVIVVTSKAEGSGKKRQNWASTSYQEVNAKQGEKREGRKDNIGLEQNTRTD